MKIIYRDREYNEQQEGGACLASAASVFEKGGVVDLTMMYYGTPEIHHIVDQVQYDMATTCPTLDVSSTLKEYLGGGGIFIDTETTDLEAHQVLGVLRPYAEDNRSIGTYNFLTGNEMNLSPYLAHLILHFVQCGNNGMQDGPVLQAGRAGDQRLLNGNVRVGHNLWETAVTNLCTNYPYLWAKADGDERVLSEGYFSREYPEYKRLNYIMGIDKTLKEYIKTAPIKIKEVVDQGGTLNVTKKERRDIFMHLAYIFSYLTNSFIDAERQAYGDVVGGVVFPRKGVSLLPVAQRDNDTSVEEDGNEGMFTERVPSPAPSVPAPRNSRAMPSSRQPVPRTVDPVSGESVWTNGPFADLISVDEGMQAREITVAESSRVAQERREVGREDNSTIEQSFREAMAAALVDARVPRTNIRNTVATNNGASPQTGDDNESWD